MNRGSKRLRRMPQDCMDFDRAAVLALTAGTEQIHFGALPDGGEKLRRALQEAWQRELTPTQQKYMLLYYGQHMKMREIAGRYGVAKPTVSRTILRGRERLRRVLQYYL